MPTNLVHDSCICQAQYIHKKLIELQQARSNNSIMDEKAEMGRRIKAAREAAGLTQKELCKKVPGLRISTLSNYEQGTREAPVSTLKQIARALDVSAAYILTVDDTILCEREKKLIAMFRQTDERGKASITSVAESQPALDADNLSTFNSPRKATGG
jgi:transcriptional regulator with XRE-family HTH domain